MYDALMESKELLRNFWQFLKRQTPLDPLQASYFTKVNESLFDKKTEEMLDLLKSMDGAVSDILRHVDCPMIMDLLLKIISLERTESGQGIVEVRHPYSVSMAELIFLLPVALHAKCHDIPHLFSRIGPQLGDPDIRGGLY